MAELHHGMGIVDDKLIADVYYVPTPVFQILGLNQL
jgi:hypothetical protein